MGVCSNVFLGVAISCALELYFEVKAAAFIPEESWLKGGTCLKLLCS